MKRFALYLPLIFLHFSCEEIIVENISNVEVNLISPTDSLSTLIGEQNLFWEEVIGAENYRITIANPNFESPKLILLDSITGKINLKISLDPGHYSWRVRAQNSAYNSPYSTNQLTILDSL